MRSSILVVVLVAALTKVSANTYSQNHVVNDYVSKYLEIASFESIRSGIPTSIILSQGILESGCGNSILATRANNHFGIKWKSEKDGEYFSMMDDDKNRKGQRVASKFIVYGSADESYRHHTDFLVNGERYKRLFEFERTDYRNWAKGLSECKYATDPQYAQKLIQTIEKYQLNQYDIPMVLSLEDEDDAVEPSTPVEPNNILPATTQGIKKPQPTRIIEIANTDSNDDDEAELFEIVGETVETKGASYITKPSVKTNKNTVKKAAPTTKAQPTKKSTKKK